LSLILGDNRTKWKKKKAALVVSVLVCSFFCFANDLDTEAEVSSEESEEAQEKVGSKRKFDQKDDTNYEKKSRSAVTLFVGNLPFLTISNFPHLFILLLLF